MKFGLTSDEFTLLNEYLLLPLKKAGAQVWIFGSRARGDHKPFSDIDILFRDIKDNVNLNLLSSLREGLENSNLPYKVDVVSEKELAESYQKNVFEERIEL